MTKPMTIIMGLALAAAMAAPMPAVAGWNLNKLKEQFSNHSIGKALGDKYCWGKAFSFQQAYKDKCKREN